MNWSDRLRDDAGEDLVEYALLACLIGIAAVLTWKQVAASVATAYGAADTGVQGLADPPNPGGGM